ncbi:hypothetical protein HanPSC8_Chr06g0254171 [Helianthus annuus]|nr:hypothetical protein HanPSC8_Chr06g0254171 [Helianthus annuus]
MAKKKKKKTNISFITKTGTEPLKIKTEPKQTVTNCLVPVWFEVWAYWSL